MRSVDPNGIEGPSGFGPQGFVQPAPFSYGIEFENKPSATAPAQVVTVTQQIDPNLDWSTFTLGDIVFGDNVVDVPAGQTSYSTQVDLTATLGIYVDITANFNTLTGLATWTFTSIDPTTLDVPSDPLVGFLPPNDAEGDGQAVVDYAISPYPNAPTGTAINAQATVVFDANAPLTTADFLNTIDAVPPTSSVATLPAQSSPTFTVSWSGQDDPGGSGVASYDVYVSDDGGAFTPFETNTTATSATFTGQVGHTYGFYSVATDNAGNVQATPTTAQATTTVGSSMAVTSIASVSPNPLNTDVSSLEVTFNQPIDTSSLAPGAITLTDNGQAVSTTGLSLSLVSGDTYAINGLAAATAAEGSYTLSVNAADINDQNGNPGSGTVSTSWLMDATPPTSSVSTLPAQTSSTSFTVSVTSNDPAGASNSPASGVASIAIYDSVNGGAFTLWTTVTPASPSAAFTGQAGDTYGFYSVATDAAGNVQPTPATAQETVQILAPLSVSSIATVSPSTRNTAVSSVDVTFSLPINVSSFSTSAVSLTDNGTAVTVGSGVTLTLVSGTTYALSGLGGLTGAEGSYTLTIHAADIDDTYGNPGTGAHTVSWLMDTTPPTSSVAALPASTIATSFTLTINATDPAGSNASTPSGIASVAVYDATDGGAYTLLTTLTPSTHSASFSGQTTFTGQAGHAYAFYSVATDVAGNVQPTPASAQATTSISFVTAATTTSVTSSDNPATVGDAVTFTATVSAAAGTPTGTIQFEIDGSPAGAPMTLNDGTASFTTTLTEGSHSVTANYTSNAGSFASSTGSLAGGETVKAAVVIPPAQVTTTTALIASITSSVFGQAVTFTATVSPQTAGAQAPAGSVSFMDGSTVLGTASLSGGVAQFTATSLGLGGHSIQAVYAGAGNDTGSQSGTTSLTVQPDASTIVVTPSANPSPPKGALTLTATVAPAAPGGGTPTGTVTFYNGKKALGTATLNGGVATLVTKKLTTGSHTITATYQGDSDFTASTSPGLRESIKKVKGKKSKAVVRTAARDDTRVVALAPHSGATALRLIDLALEDVLGWRRNLDEP